jgi:hypothetical protein
MRGAAALLLFLGACAGGAGPELTRFEIDHVDVVGGSAESARSNLPEELAVLRLTGEGVEIRGMIPPCATPATKCGERSFSTRPGRRWSWNRGSPAATGWDARDRTACPSPTTRRPSGS